MEYKGYLGKVEYDDEAGIFHGEVINTRDVITFQGESVAALKKAFKESINDYLAFCKERGELPDKPFSGQFVTRIPPELHRQVSVAAAQSKKSLNAWVTEQLESAMTKKANTRTSSRQKRGRKLNASKKISRPSTRAAKTV